VTKKTKHYLPDGKVYTGPVHKVGSRVMTGATHTAAFGDPLTLAAEDFFRMRFVQATNFWYRIA